MRPLHIGLSVAHLHGQAGTLGAFVRTSNRDIGVLSNNHILSSISTLRHLIIQPSALDIKLQSQEIQRHHEIGYFENCIHISKRVDNKVDAAYAILNKDISHEGNLLPRGFAIPDEGRRIAEAADPLDPEVLVGNSTVAKFGRTTGYTSVSGNTDKPLVAVASVSVKFADVGEINFCDVIEIPWESNNIPFSQGGDSGSLIFLPGSLRAIGLHFASGERKDLDTGRSIMVSYACNLSYVLRHLELTLVT
ncbi:MAG: hypothetical protein V7K64_28395 [Nostoc sp.]